MDVCRGRELALPDGEDVEQELVPAARFHRLAPLAYVAVRDGVRPRLASELRRDREKAFWHHLRVSAVLGELARLLDGLSWLTFKGPVLSETAHPVPGLRVYKDADVLVAPSHLRAALDRLFAAGWNVILPNDVVSNPVLPGQIDLASPAGVLLDLHWSMVITDEQRRRYPVVTESLIERRVPRTIGASQVWTFDQVDTLVHVCHHAALAGATRMLHLLDADQLARQVDDWDRVVARAGSWGATVHLALVLGRAHRLLGTPIPPDLRAMIGLPASFEAVTSVVDRFCPISTLRRDGSWPRLVAGAARPSGVATAGTMIRNGTLIMLDRARGRPQPQRRVPADRDVIDGYVSAVEEVSRHSTSPL